MKWGSIQSVTQKRGIDPMETVRKWLRRSRALSTLAGEKAAEETEELKRLKAENHELRRANEIWKVIAEFFAA